MEIGDFSIKNITNLLGVKIKNKFHADEQVFAATKIEGFGKSYSLVRKSYWMRFSKHSLISTHGCSTGLVIIARSKTYMKGSFGYANIQQ